MPSDVQMEKTDMYYIQFDDNKNDVLRKLDMLLPLPQCGVLL